MDGAPRTHSGIAAKGAASSEKALSVDELVDELAALVAMHKRSPLQLQELHSSLQAVTAKAAAAEKVAAEKEKVAVEKAAVEKAAVEKAAAEKAAAEKAAAEKAAVEKAAAKKEPSRRIPGHWPYPGPEELAETEPVGPDAWTFLSF